MAAVVLDVDERPVCARLASLTARQREVARLASRGLSNAQIGYALGVSESAAATHVSVALEKLTLRRRQQLVSLHHHLCDPVRDAGSSPPGRRAQLLAKLTAAERAVAEDVLRALTNADIARRRGTSVRTVDTQVRAIYRKLRVGSRAQLAVLLREDPRR